MQPTWTIKDESAGVSSTSQYMLKARTVEKFSDVGPGKYAGGRSRKLIRKKLKAGDVHRASLLGIHAVRARLQSTQLPAEQVPVDKESIVGYDETDWSACGDATEGDRPTLGFLCHVLLLVA